MADKIEKLKGLLEVCNFIKENDDFVIVNHLDADGLAAGAIFSLLLKRLGKKYKITTIKQLGRETATEVHELGDTFIFADLGSGQIEILNELYKNKKYCILDHHKPFGETAAPHFNPHLSGYDGTNELSGAGAAYFIAKEIDKENVGLSKLAIIGAVGDMQDSRGALEGLNRICVEDGIKCGEVVARKDIRFFGRHSRPLAEFIAYSTDPGLPGLFGNEPVCREFIHSLGIKLTDGKNWFYYCDLTSEEQKKLLSALYVYGKRQGIPEETLRNLVGEVYEFPKEEPRSYLRDAKEFATLLNACGRHGCAEVAIKVCEGDRTDYLAKANALLQKHRKMLREGAEWCKSNPPIEMKNMYVVDAGKVIHENILGIIMGMLYSNPGIKRNKPIVGMVIDENGGLKVSARANWVLVRAGLDLGSAIHEICKEFGFVGGGHKIAAGANIAPEKKEDFLRLLDELIGKQLKESKA